MSRIASLMYAMPHLLEWDCLDDIIKEALFNMYGHVFSGGVRDQKNMHRWGRLLVEVLR